MQSVLASDTQTISPCHSVGSHGDISPTSLAKKRRIAHTRREEDRANSSTVEPGTGATDVALPVTQALEPAKVGRLRGRPSISERGDSGIDKNSNTGTSNFTSVPPDCDDPTQFDYITQYIQITSPDQKKRYRRDFDSEYDEYCRLHERVFPPTQKFEEFNRRLREHTPGSAPYEKLKQDVLTEYSKLKSNVKYLEDRRRFEYLHRKLAHIKKLVQDFDNSNKTAS